MVHFIDMLGEARDTILECNEAPYQSAVGKFPHLKVPP